MTVHICRDFLTTLGCNGSSQVAYLLGIFLKEVLDFSVVGHTNFELTSSISGTALANGATINLGATKEAYVQVPSWIHTVDPINDANKIIALKSTTNPTYNSGLFRILSGSASDNAFIIDFRAPSVSGSYPIPESGSLKWTLYPSEDYFWPDEHPMPLGSAAATYFTYISASAGVPSSSYCTIGTGSTYPRIVMQTPHSSSWQVRICCESPGERGWDIGSGLWWQGLTPNGVGSTPNATKTYMMPVSVAVGYGGDNRGDFQIGGAHTHRPLWANQNGSSNANCVPGFGDQETAVPQIGGAGLPNWLQSALNTQQRVYIWGDDDTGSVFFAERTISQGQFSYWLSFGLPQNEPDTTLAFKNRVFTIGNTLNCYPGPYSANNVTMTRLRWDGMDAQTGFRTFGGGAYGFKGQPISCTPIMYTFRTAALVNGSADNNRLSFSQNAFMTLYGSDCPFINATELMPIELLVGSFKIGTGSPNWNNYYTSYAAPWATEARMLGEVRIAKVGRANFAEWMTTSDTDRSYFHASAGLYLPWSGPQVLP